MVNRAYLDSLFNATKERNPNPFGQGWYVDTVNGDDADKGKNFKSAFATMGAALAVVESGDTVYFVGNITEELSPSNLLEDVTIVGCSNRPRHADHARDGVGTVSGASWREAAAHGTTTPLLTLRGQGWRLVNFLMVPPSDAAAVMLERNALSGSSEYDASHFSAHGTRFTGGQSGIEDTGGQFNVSLRDCKFQALTDGIKTINTLVAVPKQWDIRDCEFVSNTHHIRVSGAYWSIRDNVFGKFTSAPSIDLSFIAGNDGIELVNVITRNLLSGTYNNTNYIQGAGTTDEWGGNLNVISGGVTAAQP